MNMGFLIAISLNPSKILRHLTRETLHVAPMQSRRRQFREFHASDAADFYQPVHTDHLAELLPAVIKYLRLPHGSKFIIDDNGFEDVWLVQ
ncbi:immunity protein Imm33 domain-containing protein [Burkholderia multivorans]|uniref:immunity protein Imm33 domain-containing protein n=1 Tax=Burkholderia multivorans TaxID=87883 RepID=UPI003F576A74